MTQRETFGSRFGGLAIGLAVGLGNVWRFSYMVGQFGGAAFILLYLLIASLVAVPATMGEWSLGRHTRLGTLGEFHALGVPGGKGVGCLLVMVTWSAVAYYTNAIGWVVYHAITELAAPFGRPFDASQILPPETSFSAKSMGLQIGFTSMVLLTEAWVVLRGIRRGIERAPMILTPMSFVTLLIVIV